MKTLKKKSHIIRASRSENLDSKYNPWWTHEITVGHRTINTGDEYGYLVNVMGALNPVGAEKIISKHYLSPDHCWFLSYTMARLDGYIAFEFKGKVYKFSYKDNLYDNKAIYDIMSTKEGQTFKIYIGTELPWWA